MKNISRSRLKDLVLVCLTSAVFLVLVGLLAVPRSVGADSSPQGEKIVDVKFDGLKTLKERDLLDRIVSKPGATYDADQVAADLKNLGKKALEAEVRREQVDGGLRLVFVITENPTLAEVRFVGNSQIKNTELARVARIKAGEVITRETVGTAREGVLTEYRDRGFMRTQVAASIVRNDKGDAVLQILVNEGKKIKVEDLQVSGNHFYGKFRIKLALDTKGSWTIFKNYFDENAFDSDLQTVKKLYEDAGFFDVKVERGEFRYDEAKQTISPSIIISEGPHYRLGKVTVGGNTFFTREEIEANFDKLRGEFFDAKEFAIALDKVRSLYQNAGYVTTEVNYQDVNLDHEKGEVNIPLIVDEKHRARVGKIGVQRPGQLDSEGRSWFGRIYNSVAPPVSDDTVFREMALKSGEVYDKRKETESVEKLKALGVFDEVAIESRSTDNPDVRDVVVKVTEGMTGNVLMGVGFSDAYGVYAFGSYAEKNLMGQAGDFRASALVGTKAINATISYFDRYLGTTDYSLYSEVHHERASRPGYDEVNTGLRSELGKPINDEWKAYVQGRLEYVQLEEDGDPKEDFNRNYPVLAARLRATHDTRFFGDSKPGAYFPTAGHLAGMAFEAGFADGPLAKLTGSYEWYHKVSENMVFATDINAGIMPVDANKIGPTERFYMGGTEDLRGFAFRRAGPHDSKDNDVPLGGATKLVARNELRYPLIDNLTGLVFLDAGTLSHQAFTLSSPRASTGLGLRLGMKGVQAGVDVAAPLLHGKDDQLRYFHFSVSGLSPLRGF